jgi:mediator of RNA polymerase II transcription subunit 17
LAIAKEKRYMVLDPVPQEIHESKPMAQVYARKKVCLDKCFIVIFIMNYKYIIVYLFSKALAGAASVLLTGAERLRTCQNEAARNRTTPDFHIELLRLRQNWRLKKVSNTIIGDLSYRTGKWAHF